MKKHIIIISSILQFVAVVMYFATIRSGILLSQGKTTFGIVIFVAVIATIAQVLSVKLKERYGSDVEKAEEIMQKPKTSYGWIALGLFGLVLVFIVIYVFVTK